MKLNSTALIATIVLIICAIITYFGRIYYPNNFYPETVSFFENYWVLVLGLCFIIGLISVCILILLYFGNKLLKDIKSLLY